MDEMFRSNRAANGITSYEELHQLVKTVKRGDIKHPLIKNLA